ncbi:MAG: hypothetical protein PHF37_06845 [Phycisphaerae bacterium]|nr:hypothetical protein [Phycisphaerae bacterium]
MANLLLTMMPVPMELVVIALIFLAVFGIPLAIVVILIVFAIRRRRKVATQIQLKIAELESQIAQLKNRND